MAAAPLQAFPSFHGSLSLPVPQFSPSAIPPLEAVGLRAVDPTDVDTMARTVVGEGRGEDLLCQAGIAWSIVNRVFAARRDPGRHSWWGDTLSKVCLKQFQYSAWLEGDPNLPIIKAAHLGQPIYDRALGVCLLVLSGDIADPTDKATHYHDPSIATPSAWSVLAPVHGPAPMKWFREGSW